MAMNIGIPSVNNRSIYDDIWITAISSASGQTDLKYVVELYDGAAKIFEGKVVPEPSNKYMYFNVAPIARNVFSEEFYNFNFQDNYPMAVSGFCYNNQKPLNIRIGSDYSGITNLNQASGTCTVYPERPKFNNRRFSKKNSFTDFFNKWYSDRYNVATLTNNSDKFFIGYNLDTGDDVEIKWESFNSANILLSSSSYTNVDNLGGANNILNIGPDGLYSIIGSKPNLSTCDYYIVTLRWNNLSDFGNVYYLTFRINKHCQNKYKTIPIHFYNRFNSVDTMRFDLVSRTTMDVERKSYNQRDYRFSGSSVLYTDSSASGTTVFRENKINYNAVYNYTMKLTSDFLDDQDWEWLEDLILSPRIYMEEDGYMYPVTIKATNYEISKYINNRLRPLEIDIEFNSPRLSSSR